MKNIFHSLPAIGLLPLSLMLFLASCHPKAQQQAGPEERVKDFNVEAQPRKFQNAPPNASVIRLLFSGDSISFVDMSRGSASFTQYDPSNPDPDVIRGIKSVYRYTLLTSDGRIIVSGYFPVDPRIQSFYPGTGEQRKQILHETTTLPEVHITLTVPIDTSNLYTRIALQKITYENGKPVMDVQQNIAGRPQTIIQLPIKRQ